MAHMTLPPWPHTVSFYNVQHELICRNYLGVDSSDVDNFEYSRASKKIELNVVGSVI
jgi:hypothetical protein